MNWNIEKALKGCIATFLFLIALMRSYLKYVEVVEAGAEGAPAILYMLVMFFVIFIVAGSITLLLVGILTPIATKGIMHLLPIHQDASLSSSDDKTLTSSCQLSKEDSEKLVAHQQTVKNKNAQSLQQQTENNLLKEKQVLEEIFAYTRGTFQKVFTSTQIETLIQNIQELYRICKEPSEEGKICHFREVETEISTYYYNYDLEHYGWNVSTRIRMLCKKMNQGETIPHFLKVSFPYAFALKDESSIKTKLTNETSKLPLINGKEEMTPYVFPGTEQLPTKTD